MPALTARARLAGPTAIVARFAAALLGGYVFAYGLTAAATLAGFAAGLPFFEAQTLAWLFSFLVYAGAMLWAFAERSLARVWLVLGGGGCALSAAAWALSRQMV